MRPLVVAFCLVPSVLLADSVPKPMSWFSVTRFFYTDEQVRMWADNPVYSGANIANGQGWGTQQKRVWHTVDLRPLGVGYDPDTRSEADPLGKWIGAKVVELVCDLLITGYPMSAEDKRTGIVKIAPLIVDYTITLRKHGSTTALPDKYMGQVTESHRGGGQRSNFTTKVPLSADGKFDYLFNFPDDLPLYDGTATGGPAVGANCSVHMWAN